MESGMQFTRKRFVFLIVILVLLLGMIFREKLIQTYVVVAREHLVAYAENLLVLLTLLLLFTMTGCGVEKKNSVLSDISKEIGVDVVAGEVISESDTHGGFHGDGDTVIVLQIDDTSFSNLIKENEEWNAMPLTENLTALVYGLHTETSSIGPMIHPGDNISVVPEIENGYYYFRDRHYQSKDPKDDTDVLSRASYNFTIAIYDTDTNILYYLELDT